LDNYLVKENTVIQNRRRETLKKANLPSSHPVIKEKATKGCNISILNTSSLHKEGKENYSKTLPFEERRISTTI